MPATHAQGSINVTSELVLLEALRYDRITYLGVTNVKHGTQKQRDHAGYDFHYPSRREKDAKTSQQVWLALVIGKRASHRITHEVCTSK